jgi:hypothetical protein
MKKWIDSSFPGIASVDNDGDTFWYYDPTGEGPPERWIPLATLVTGDRYDTVSDLGRPGRYRLNVGLTKATYQKLFEQPPPAIDYTATDVVLPHPEYGTQNWVCVVNPTLDTVRDLLAEAFEFAVRKHTNREARR